MTVVINGEVIPLNKDGSVQLGVQDYYRETGTKEWKSTTVCGRAKLTAGKEYETFSYPGGSFSDTRKLTLFEKISKGFKFYVLKKSVPLY